MPMCNGNVPRLGRDWQCGYVDDVWDLMRDRADDDVMYTERIQGDDDDMFGYLGHVDVRRYTLIDFFSMNNRINHQLLTSCMM